MSDATTRRVEFSNSSEVEQLINRLQSDIDALQAEVNRMKVERDLLLRIKLERIAEVGDYDGWPENYPSIKAHDDWLRKS